LALEKYAISDAISSSVKLGVWEASLEGYISSIEFVTDVKYQFYFQAFFDYGW